MYKVRRLFTIIYSPYAIALCVAMILTGCSADSGLLTGAEPIVVFADAAPRATSTPLPVDTPSPSGPSVIDGPAVDGLIAAKKEPVALVSTSLTTSGDKAGPTGEDLPGIQVYRENFCGTCHELAAAQTAAAFGPSHNQAGLLAEARVRDANYTGNAATAADYIRESLLEPAIYLVPGYEVTYMKMPPFTHLKDEEIDALVIFLIDQK